MDSSLRPYSGAVNAVSPLPLAAEASAAARTAALRAAFLRSEREHTGWWSVSARSRRLGGDTRGRVVDRHATETRGIGSGRGRRQHSLSLGLLERLCLRGTDGQRRRQDAERGAEEGPVDREEEGDGRSGQNVYRARARAPVDVLRTTVSTAPCKHASCEARPPHGVTCVAVERSASRPVPARGDGGHVRGRCGGERGARCASGRNGAGRRRAEVVHGADDGHVVLTRLQRFCTADGKQGWKMFGRRET